MKRIWVAFCGLVRKPGCFEKSLIQLSAAKKSGLIEGIIFSTWLGEVDSYKDLRQLLKRCDVVLIETPEPVGPELSIFGSGNIARQKVALAWALEMIPDSAFVFKTRPDQPIATTPRIADLLRFLTTTDFQIRGVNNPCIPYRIWFGRRNRIIPFFIDDRNFFTHASVAKEMCALRAEIFVFLNKANNIAEINWFAPLFWDQMPIIKRVLCVDWLKVHFSGQDTSYLDALTKCDIFWLSQAIYEQILRDYFFIGFDGFDISEYDFLGPDPLRIFELPSSIAEVFEERKVLRGDKSYESASVFLEDCGGKNLYSKLFPAMSLLDKYVDATVSFGSLKISREISVPDPEGVSSEVLACSDLSITAPEPVIFFDQNYIDRISLEVNLPRDAVRNSFVTALVRINDPNEDGALALCEQICVGYRWYKDGLPLWLEFPRIPVNSYQRPLTEVAFNVLTPPVEGTCIFEVDLLIEGKLWFGRIAQAQINVVG